MEFRRLTKKEKEAIRNSPCGSCGAVPPFPDGNRCQTHRIVPRSKGGQYTKKNTVPRCPLCHSKEPGHNGWFILLPLSKRQAAGRKIPSDDTRAKMSAAYHGKHLSAENQPNWGKKLSPEHCAKISAANKGKHHSPEQRAKNSAAQKGKTLSAETKAKISATMRGKTNRGPYTRWHTTRRGVLNPNCVHCQKKLSRLVVAAAR